MPDLPSYTQRADDSNQMLIYLHVAYQIVVAVDLE